MQITKRLLVLGALLGATASTLSAATNFLDDKVILARIMPSDQNDAMVLLRNGKPQDPSEVSREIANVQPEAPAPPPRVVKAIPAPTKKPVAVVTAKPKPKASAPLAKKPLAVAKPVHKPTPRAVAVASKAPVAIVTPQVVDTPHAAETPHIVIKPPVAALATHAPTPDPITTRALIAALATPYAAASVYVAPPAKKAQPLATSQPIFVVADEHSFVPTSDVSKPSNEPTPAPSPQQDLNWQYAHRFDSTTESDDAPIPGIPVRSQASSPFGTKTGAFHGVRSLNGYSATRVSVTIPCGAARFQQINGHNEVTGRDGLVDAETGYIYIGGWGAGPNGVAVDAGLQKSSSQAQQDAYAFYWKYASNKPVTATKRFPCGGPPVELAIYPVSPDLLVFSANGITSDGVRRTLIAVQRTTTKDGWDPTGGSRDEGIILKRITSIAQPDGWNNDQVMSRKRWSSGTYFGIGGPNDPTPKIVWEKCEIGRVQPPRIVPTYHEWTDNDTWHPTSGSYTDWPPSAVKLIPHVACDEVGLYLNSGI